MTLSGHHRDDGEPAFWGHRLLQQLATPLRRRELRLESGDPVTSGHQLGELFAPQPGPLSAVDQVLGPPVVDRLAAHAEIAGDV